jgi:serine/threonine protein kinase
MRAPGLAETAVAGELCDAMHGLAHCMAQSTAVASPPVLLPCTATHASHPPTHPTRPLQKYEFQSQLGEGIYGVVFKCVHKESGATVAVKCFKVSLGAGPCTRRPPTCACSHPYAHAHARMLAPPRTHTHTRACTHTRAHSPTHTLSQEAHTNKDIMRLALREIRNLNLAEHPNVVKLHEAIMGETGQVYIVMDFVPHSLQRYLELNPSGLPEQQVQLIMWQLLAATSLLHSKVCEDGFYSLYVGRMYEGS